MSAGWRPLSHGSRAWLLLQDPQAFADLEWPGDVRDAPAFAWPWWLGLAALLLVAGARWQRTRRRPRPVASAAAASAPTAWARLQALALPADAAATGAFYTELKALVRLHCRERFGLRADVATSEELVRALPLQPALPRCLSACDRVLFGGALPGAEEHRDSRDAALAFAAAGRDQGAP